MPTSKNLIYRFLVWIMVFVVCFSMDKVITHFRNPEPYIGVNCDFSEITEFNSIQYFKVKWKKTNYNVENPTLIIDKPNQQIEGFTEYKNYLYSPLVLFTGNLAFEHDSGFTVKNTDADLNYRSAEKNLNTILTAIEENKTWADIGINPKVLEGTVTLAIPDKNSEFYPYVEELFLLNLGEEITTDNISELKNRVNKIIDKCIKVEDEEGYLSVNYKKEELGKVIMVAPEYIMKTSSTSMFTFTESKKEPSYYVPIYPTKTTAISYSMYIKNDTDEDLKTKIFETYSGENFSQTTGFRTLYKNYDNKYIPFRRTINNLNITYIMAK